MNELPPLVLENPNQLPAQPNQWYHSAFDKGRMVGMVEMAASFAEVGCHMGISRHSSVLGDTIQAGGDVQCVAKNWPSAKNYRSLL